MKKIIIKALLPFLFTITSNAMALTCTFEVDNDVTKLPKNQFTLTAMSPDIAYQNFHWQSSILEPNGKIIFTTDAGFPYCDEQGTIIGPYLVFSVEWVDSSDPLHPYHGVTYSGSLQEPVTKLSRLQASAYSSAASIAPVPLPPKP
jgi:hypothetical protein